MNQKQKKTQKRGASANRTQADHSRRERESLIQIHLKRHERLGNRMHCFHQGAPNRETNSRVLSSSTLIRQILGRSLLEANKDHLLSQARSELVKQEHQVGSLNNCISELQRQAYAQRLELQDAQRGYIESRRGHVRLQEELSMKEKLTSPRYSNPTYARNGRNEESSGIASRRILTTKMKRKSRHNAETHFTIAVHARTNELIL